MHRQLRQASPSANSALGIGSFPACFRLRRACTLTVPALKARRASTVVHVSSGEIFRKGPGSGGNAPSNSSDPFITAGIRLQELLQEASWDDGEQIRQDLLSLPIEARLAFFTNISTILMTVALVVGWITNGDPLGGMSFSSPCMFHALAGIGFALPLVATSLVGRLPRVRRTFPVLEALHDCQEKVLEPMFEGLDVPQLLIVCSCATLPLLLLLLPAMHGSCMAMGDWFQEGVLTPAGLHIAGPIKEQLSILIPTLASSYFAGAIMAKQLAVKRHQYEAIQGAMSNSDRYFKLTESMALQSGDSGQQSRKVSDAFKAVSVVWILMRKKVCQLSFMLTAMNVCYLAMIWHETQDLSTPLACAMLVFGLELLLCKRSLSAKELARSRVGPGTQ